MSNYLAVATATAAIRQILLNAFSSATYEFMGASVKTERPEKLKEAGFVGANLYLYQVGPNAAYRNSDLATRTSSGSLIQRPQVGLDLNYLLTFYGDDDTLEPQRLLGCAVSALNAQPVLTRPLIQEAVELAREFGDYLKGSDLTDQIESVKITPLYLNLDEISKLWTVFFQTAHTLSIFYQGSVVLIDADLVPEAQLPTRAANFYTSLMPPPVIGQISSQQGANEPIVAGTTLIVSGERLSAYATHALADGIELPVDNIDPGGASFNVTIPLNLLMAGTQNLKVVRETLMGTPPKPVAVESNTVSFVLRPTITKVSVLPREGDGDEPPVTKLLEVRVGSLIGATQQVVLLLNEIVSRPPASYTFNVNARARNSNRIVVPIPGVEPGTYLVRLRVDGAESLLVVDSDPTSPSYNRYIAPQVIIE